IRKPGVELFKTLLAGEDFFPHDFAFPAVGFCDGRVENADRSPPDIRPGPVALDEGDDRLIRHIQPAGGVGNRCTLHEVAPSQIRSSGRLWGFHYPRQTFAADEPYCWKSRPIRATFPDHSGSSWVIGHGRMGQLMRRLLPSKTELAIF